MRLVPEFVRVCAVIACVASGATALRASQVEDPLGPPVACRSYGVPDGLPRGNIYTLAQDREGYLWLGGVRGLLRFDGVQFVPWGAHGEPSLPQTEVNSIVADRDGGLWVGFLGGGAISHLADRRIQTYTTKDGLPQGVVNPRAQDRDGVVWAVGPGGIAAFHGQKWEQRHGVNGLPAAAAIDAHEDESGALWISTADGVYRRRRGQERFELVDRGLASAMADGPRGGVWVVHAQQGLRQLSGTPSNEGPSISLTGQRMVGDRRGALWVGSPYRAGLVHVSADSRTRRMTASRLADDRGVIDKLVLALLEDSDGSIWAGTNGGLLRCHAWSIQTYSSANGLPDNNVRAIDAGRGDTLWLGTAQGLATLDAAERITVSRVPGVYGREVTSLHGDPQGRLWIGFADSGLGVLANGHFSSVQTPGGTSPDNVITVRPDRNGGLWVCNLNDRGLYYQHGQSPFVRIQPPSAPLNVGCSATLVDHDNRVWIGFDDGTLLVQEVGGEQRVLRDDDGVRGRVCTIYEDRERTVWIATTDGLSRYRDGHFSTISARHGLPGNYISAVIEDESGDLWIGADAGILNLTKREFERSVTDPAHRVLYTLYDASDGVTDSPICRGEPRATRDRQGRLWFTSVGGAIVLDPKHVRQEAPPPAPRVERVVADGIVRTGGNVALPARTESIELQYTAANLSAGPKMRFQYRLGGFDAAWVDAGSRRQAFYTNLEPGRYRFEVRARMNDVAGPAATYEFDIEPAFYQTRSFYAGIGAFGAVLLFGAWQLRVRALRKQYTLIMSERTRIGREIHDTVLQEMAGVALEIDAVARRTDTPGPKLRNALAHISDEIKDHIEEARDTILELRSPEEGKMNLATSLREAGERILTGTAAHFDFAITGTPRPCEVEVERELIRIAREALRNAARHASATCVRLELVYAADALHLAIRDDGTGFDVERQRSDGGKHWGLVGMKERAARIRAHLDIQSGRGLGTAIEIVVPCATAD
jgi:signal transduction histidine kinase/ligand-binding sensor domain-containing protein